MAPAKRKSRRKEPSEAAETDLPDSSPSRPSTKRRKTNPSRRSQNQRKDSVPEPTLPAAELPGDENDSDSSPEDGEQIGNKDLIESVISYLQVAPYTVAVASEHANEKIDEAEKVTAYAKIAGRDWTYFVVGQNVNIGRPPDKDHDASRPTPSSPLTTLKENHPVHIDLGPSKYVSRHHACVFYDAEYPDTGGWHLRVNGRNGVKVNNYLLKRAESHQLISGDVMEISGTQMMFVTPGDKAVIDHSFVERAKMAAPGDSWTASQHAHPPNIQTGELSSGSLYPIKSNSHKPLAPAPPGFKRTLTPPPAPLPTAQGSQNDGRDQRSVFDGRPAPSPMYNRGLMMESTQDIDYSQDTAKDLKPPFSYATMIAQAIFSNAEEKLTLSNIYAWIAEKYAFYRHSNSGWQNSIRHNLSLNKAFQKVPRRTDEPGKGMKWQIAPEFRQEYLDKQAKKGLPMTSSAPTSPAAPGSSKDIAPNFRGPNGQNLGYDSSYVSQFSAVNIQAQSQAKTPERRSRKNTQTTAPDPDLDRLDSPFPTRPGPLNTSPPKQSHYMSASAGQQQQQLSQQSPPRMVTSHDDQPASNPTLSSSYLDTPFNVSHSNMITPAPRKLQNIRLAPPSTLVAPSKFMPPDSSPAGPHGSFWRGLMSAGGLGFLGSTPAGPALDTSPIKRQSGIDGGAGEDIDGNEVMSSSPPPIDGPGASPSKRISQHAASRFIDGLPRQLNLPSHDPRKPNGAIGHGPARATGALRNDASDEQDEDNDRVIQGREEDDSLGAEADEEDLTAGLGGAGGFDLARGFQPIGSAGFFPSSSSGNQPLQRQQPHQLEPQPLPQFQNQHRQESQARADRMENDSDF